MGKLRKDVVKKLKRCGCKMVEAEIKRLIRLNYARFDRLCSMRELGKIDMFEFRKKENPIVERGRKLRMMLGYSDKIVSSDNYENSGMYKKRAKPCTHGKGSSAKNAKK